MSKVCLSFDFLVVLMTARGQVSTEKCIVCMLLRSLKRGFRGAKATIHLLTPPLRIRNPSVNHALGMDTTSNAG